MTRGTCLCGAVSFEIEGPLEHRPEACHCTQCRKQTGHFLVAVNVRRSALTVHGADKVTWYRSSEQAQRGFCSVCGSTLFWDGKGRDYISIAAGSLDLPTGIHLAQHIFTEEKGDYYEIEDGIAQTTGGKFSVQIPG